MVNHGSKHAGTTGKKALFMIIQATWAIIKNYLTKIANRKLIWL